MKVLTLPRDFFRTFVHVSILCFTQLGVIPRAKNKIFETVVVAERCSVRTHVKSKESKNQLFLTNLPVKLANGRMSIKKGKKIFVTNLQYCQFEQDIFRLSRMEKTEPFS